MSSCSVSSSNNTCAPQPPVLVQSGGHHHHSVSSSPLSVDAASIPSHRKRRAHALVDDLFCVHCQLSCNSEASFLRHCESRRHRHMQLQAKSPPAPPTDGQSTTTRDETRLPAQVESLDRLPRTTALDQLSAIFTHLWGTLGPETVHALFLLRHLPRFSLQHSERLRKTTNVEDHAALLLSVPNLVLEAAGRARATLACGDLPERHPTLILEHSQRLRLQHECLHRALLTTVLADNMQLLRLAVEAAMHNGTARALITDTAFGMGYLASSLASAVLSTSTFPGSPFHSAWHSSTLPSLTPRSHGRRMSESDIQRAGAGVCVCTPSSEVLSAVRDEARRLERDYLVQASRGGEDFGGSDHDDIGENEEAEFGDALEM